MALDYRRFKTPFFEVSVGDSTGKIMVNLPHHILRLCEKVELFETFETGENSIGQFSTITLSFIEGSREPASQDPTLGTKGLYQIEREKGRVDMDIAGSLTNRTGIITDLRFSGSHGITFIDPNEIKQKKITTTVQKNVIGNDTTRAHKNDNKAPTFLFQERNQIKVKWGYKEDPQTVRTMRGYIITIRTEFPESGQVRTTVTCCSTRAALDQIAAKKGVTFGKRVKVGQGYVFEDLETDVVLQKICDDAGIPAIISTNLPAPKLDRDHQKAWIAGESFDQFAMRLAKRHNCYYEVIPDPRTGVDTLIFVQKADFEAKPIIADPNLFDYKAPGSILKSVNITADFGLIGANTQTGVDENGNITTQETKEATIDLFYPQNDSQKLEKHIDFDPTNNNPIAAAKGISDKVSNGHTGMVENNPDQNNKNKEDRSEVNAAQAARAIALDFLTLGFTRITPGVITIKGIGRRYSGKYRVLTVTHTLDSSGYNCRGTATANTLAAGGVEVPDAKKGPEDEKQVDLQLFTARKTDAQVRTKLNNFLFKQ